MILPPDRDLFSLRTPGARSIADHRALVVPVNCVGVMGAGIAKEARRRFGYAFAE